MEKPQPPRQESFGITAADIESVASMGEVVSSVHKWAFVAALIGCEILLTLYLRAADRKAGWKENLIFCAVLAPPLCFPAAIVSQIFSNLVRSVLRMTWPKYASVARFHDAKKQYETWLRRQTEAYWKSLDGISFEQEMGRLFKKVGYQVSETPKTSDGGVDLILELHGQRTVVQCKAHASKVGISTARELVASMGDFNAPDGIIAAISGVTKPTQEYVRGRRIEIYDLDRIMRLQQKYDSGGA